MKAVLRAMVNIGVSYSDKENQVRILFFPVFGFSYGMFSNVMHVTFTDKKSYNIQESRTIRQRIFQRSGNSLSDILRLSA